MYYNYYFDRELPPVGRVSRFRKAVLNYAIEGYI